MPHDLDRRLRRDFPYRTGRVYLNSAGAGLPWVGAQHAAAAHFADIARRGAEARSGWLEVEESARERVSRMLRLPHADIAFLHSTTEVMSLAAASMAWKAGDEVVFPADDFPTVVLAWQGARAAGAHLVSVPIDDEARRTDLLLAAVTSRTRVVAVTHVNATTGTRVDLDRLGAACRDVGALLVVDGIEALGSIPVDFGPVDVYGAGVFKWLLSGFGTAIGVFRERARAVLTPACRGYRNPPPSRRFEYSEPNFPGLAVLDATLAYLEDVGWDTVHRRVKELTAMVDASVRRHGLVIVTPPQRGGIVSFAHRDADAVVERLRADGVDVVSKGGLVRVSPHFYNTPDDISRFDAALGAALVETSG